MAEVDVGKIGKLLALTTSGNDAESLGAIRAANAHLAEFGINWEEFFELLRAARPLHAPEIEEGWEKVFSYLLDHPEITPAMATFVAAVQQQFKLTGGVNHNQVEALRRIQAALSNIEATNSFE